MNYYHIWANLRDSRKDLEFAASLRAYLGHLQERGLIAGYRLTRRKLGFGPDGIGEFHIVIESENLTQLDAAFDAARARAGETESLHAAVYSAVKDLKFALYRDFPDR